MRRDHTVFLLGAGFSAAGGIPLMSTFLQNIREHFDNPLVSASSSSMDRYERVLKARHELGRCRDVLNLDLDNVETLFGLLDMESILVNGGIQATSEDIKHVLADTVERTYERERKRIRISVGSDGSSKLRGKTWLSGVPPEDPDSSSNGIMNMPFYDYVVGVMAGAFESVDRTTFSSSVITFNYDTVVEQSLIALGRAVDYGISRVGREDKKLRSGEEAVKVLKLHGSANWAYTGTRGQRATVYDSYSDFPPDAIPLLVPPTWKKGDVSEVMRETWAAAAKELRRATRVVVIGYSAPETDSHFKHLMASALTGNTGLYSLTAVDFSPPDSSSDVLKRYSELFAPLHNYHRLRTYSRGLEGYLLTRDVGGSMCSADARLGESVLVATFRR